MKTFDPKAVICTFGARQITGFAEGEMISVVRDADNYTLQMGAYGEGTRIKQNNEAGTITLRLQPSADDNAYLSSVAASDELNRDGLLPFGLKDLSGNDLVVAEQAFIQKYPDKGYGTEAGVMEWILRTDKLIPFYGGNS